MKPVNELAEERLKVLQVALRGGDAGAEIAQEVAELGVFLLRRVNNVPVVVKHVSYDGDAIAALRHQIDERIAVLGTGDGQEDDVLRLIADLVQYRIALWRAPIDFMPTEAAVLPPRWSADDLAAYDHVHDSNGRCIKNRTGMFCQLTAAVDL